MSERNDRSERIARLTHIARLYYEENMTQQEIAKLMGVSRPLITRLLGEARELGIVKIEVRNVDVGNPLLLFARTKIGLQDATLVPEEINDAVTNRAIVKAALARLEEIAPERLGIGWGPIVGGMIAEAEKNPVVHDTVGHICPLIGNAGSHIRNYHSNDNVRILAKHFAAKPHYLYTPAFVETSEQQFIQRRTEHYRAVAAQWQHLDVALINIADHPSNPDFGSRMRFGRRLADNHAVGRMIAYYFNINGTIIESPHDFAIQIPPHNLTRCHHVIGVCGAGTSPRALLGAVRTGLFGHIICTEELLRQAMEMA